MTLACKDCVHWLSPDAKKNASMTNVEACIFSPPSFCRDWVIRYWFSLPIINIQSDDYLIWNSLRHKKKNISGFDLFSSKDDTAIYRLLPMYSRAGVVLLIIFLTEGATRCNNIQPRTRIKGWVYYYHILYLVFYSWKVVPVCTVCIICVSGMWCGLQGRLQTFWPHRYTHTQTLRPRFVQANLTSGR